MLSFEFASSKYKLEPYNLEQFKEDNKGYAPMNIPTEVSDADWQIARRCIDGIERSLDSTIPSPGDVVIYISDSGDYRPHARVDKFCGGYGLWESASMYANRDGSCYASQASMSHSQLDSKRFYHMGVISAPFWTFGSHGSCAHGGIYFTAIVNFWYYAEPEQRFPGYNTKLWDKWYVTRLKESPSGYKYSCESFCDGGHRTAFSSDEEYRLWLGTYRGVECEGYWPDQTVVWCYKEERIPIDKKDWDMLALPVDTRLINAKIRDCKVDYDEKKHRITAYFYKVEKGNSSFWFSDESKYPFEYKLEREKDAKG